MEKEFIGALLITILFGLIRFVEMKYFDNEITPLKFFVRDVVKVFLSALVGLFIFLQFNGPLTDFINTITNNPPTLNTSIPLPIFTDDPGF